MQTFSKMVDEVGLAQKNLANYEKRRA